jgi:hypothetical protein
VEVVQVILVGTRSEGLRLRRYPRRSLRFCALMEG